MHFQDYLGILLQSTIWNHVFGLTQVFTACPPDPFPDSKARVTIVSDENMWDAFGFCEPSATNPFGDFEFLDMGDTVTKYLDVYFSVEEDVEACLFTSERDVYQIFVEVYLEFGDIHHTISCVYQDLPTMTTQPSIDNVTERARVGLNTSLELFGAERINLTDPVESGGHVHHPKGGPAQSELDLYLVDIKNRPIGNRKWRFGRYLKLAAEMIEPSGNETSFQINNCVAKSLRQNQTYTLLTVGCGDGVIIPSNKGFITSGRIAYSPPFKAFHLLDASQIIFKCSFLICEEVCDGPSCEAIRRKRDAEAIATNDDSGDENGFMYLASKTDQGLYASLYNEVILGGRYSRTDYGEKHFVAYLYLGVGFVVILTSIVTIFCCKMHDRRNTSIMNTILDSDISP